MKAIIIQARLGSTRLPKKVLKKICKKTVLEHIIERAKEVYADAIILATTKKREDSSLKNLAEKEKILFYAGEEEDVLIRFLEAAKKVNASYILRICADSPLFSIEWARIVLERIVNEKVDFVYTTGLPLGANVGAVTFDALCKEDALLPKHSPHREHVTSFIIKNPSLFNIIEIPAPKEFLRPNYRLTIDTKEDLRLFRIIYRKLYKGVPIPLKEAIELLDKNPALLKINESVKQKEVPP